MTAPPCVLLPAPTGVTEPQFVAVTELWRRLPRLFKAPWRARLPAKTLAVLGLQRSADAAAAGYLLLRPHRSSSSASQPGLWLAPADVAAVQDLVTQVFLDDQARQLKLLTRPQRKLERALRQVRAELARCAGVPTRAMPKLLSASVLHLLESLATRPTEAPALLSSRLRMPWKSAQPDAGGAYPAGSFRLSPARRPAAFLALLQDDRPRFEESMDQFLEELKARAADAEAQLVASCPVWLQHPKMRSWIATELSADRPVDAQSFLLHRLKGERKLLEAGVAVPLPQGCATPFTAAVCLVHLPVPVVLERLLLDDASESSALPGTCTEMGPTLSPEPLPARLCRVKQELAQAMLGTGRQQFLAQNTDPTAEPLHSLQVTPAAWQVLCEQAWWTAVSQTPLCPAGSANEVLRVDLGPARAALATLVDLRREELNLARLRSRLPQTLKDFYPLARSLNRRLTFICGPTNSGKTHEALEILKRVDTGTYLGPLRLLALETCDRLRADGVPTSLITGEFQEPVNGARHLCATVEMLDLHTAVDVAVIDEVQMLHDPERGSAWLQAVLGAPARHVILVGSPEIRDVVQQLAYDLGEPLEVLERNRLAPLQVRSHPVRLRDAQPQTAFIVFSRIQALTLARELRQRRQAGVSVVYGSLSAEVRREQARLFREGVNPYLVATDAIAMGLNLPVRTVVFAACHKWNGQQEVALSDLLVHQLAGRAGRHGLLKDSGPGYVSGIDGHVHGFISRALSRTPASRGKLHVSPSPELVLHIAEHLQTTELRTVLDFFAAKLSLEPWAHCAVTADQRAMAAYLDGLGLTLEHKSALLNAPARHAQKWDSRWREMCLAVRDAPPDEKSDVKSQVQPNVQSEVRPFAASWLASYATLGALESMEEGVRTLTLYGWMHYRFPALFAQQALASQVLARLNERIAAALSNAVGRRCRECSQPLAWDHGFGICDRCDGGRRHWDSYAEFDAG